MSGVLREGFKEMGRKWRRARLRRRIAEADRKHTDALEALGQQTWQSRTAGSAPDELADRITNADAQAKEVTSKLATLDEQRKELDVKRQAESARLAALQEEAQKRKALVDADLAARRAALSQAQREADAAKKHLAETADNREKEQVQAKLQAMIATITEASGEITRREEQGRKLQVELDRIAGERRQALGEIDRALAEVRKAQDVARARGVSIGAQKAEHFAELGRKFIAAGAVEPALAEEMAAVKAAEEGRFALQTSLDALAAQSKAMPPGTMVKFSALALAGLLAITTGAYATGMALSIRSAARMEQKEERGRRMPSVAPGNAPQPRREEPACEPLRNACQRAESWYRCTQNHLNAMMTQVAQAQAEATAELSTAQLRGDPASPALVQFAAALDRVLQKMVSLQTILATSAAEWQGECAKLPGPEDRAECQRAAAHVEDVVKRTRESLRRDLEQEISMLDASTAAAAGSPARTRLLANLRSTFPLLQTCQ